MGYINYQPDRWNGFLCSVYLFLDFEYWKFYDRTYVFKIIWKVDSPELNFNIHTTIIKIIRQRFIPVVSLQSVLIAAIWSNQTLLKSVNYYQIIKSFTPVSRPLLHSNILSVLALNLKSHAKNIWKIAHKLRKSCHHKRNITIASSNSRL